jgi:hypothetical protein
MLAEFSAVADHRVAVYAQEPSGGPHPGAIGQVPDQVDGLLLGQATAEQGSALPLGEAGLATAAVEQADGLGFAVVTADTQVAVVPLAVIGATRLLAAEAGQVLHRGASLILG